MKDHQTENDALFKSMKDALKRKVAPVVVKANVTSAVIMPCFDQNIVRPHTLVTQSCTLQLIFIGSQEKEGNLEESNK